MIRCEMREDWLKIGTRWGQKSKELLCKEIAQGRGGATEKTLEPDFIIFFLCSAFLTVGIIVH